MKNQKQKLTVSYIFYLSFPFNLHSRLNCYIVEVSRKKKYIFPVVVREISLLKFFFSFYHDRHVSSGHNTVFSDNPNINTRKLSKNTIWNSVKTISGLYYKFPLKATPFYTRRVGQLLMSDNGIIVCNVWFKEFDWACAFCIVQQNMYIIYIYKRNQTRIMYWRKTIVLVEYGSKTKFTNGLETS